MKLLQVVREIGKTLTRACVDLQLGSNEEDPSGVKGSK